MEEIPSQKIRDFYWNILGQVKVIESRGLRTESAIQGEKMQDVNLKICV